MHEYCENKKHKEKTKKTNNQTKKTKIKIIMGF